MEAFPADESGNPVTDVNVPVPIFDDEVNEAEQFFIVTLEVVSAENINLIQLDQNVSRCRIIDNDRKCWAFLTYTSLSHTWSGVYLTKAV